MPNNMQKSCCSLSICNFPYTVRSNALCVVLHRTKTVGPPYEKSHGEDQLFYEVLPKRALSFVHKKFGIHSAPFVLYLIRMSGGYRTLLCVCTWQTHIDNKEILDLRTVWTMGRDGALIRQISWALFLVAFSRLQGIYLNFL